jgi:selenocysteine-specific elongation factor
MDAPQRHMVVATAGHIDHGKTALVRALTGTETDRLSEEKRRGITIELGFAFLGDDITIIDVPGHERFIKTMVAGVSTVDLALLVVAADDGVMPQTREHLAILDILGVPDLFVVLTKISGQDADWLALVEEDVRAVLPQAYQSVARFFRCDSLSGEGIPELKDALLKSAKHRRSKPVGGVFRLPVDRAFSLKGYGTVVTGTIISGKVQIGDHLQVMPEGYEVRVRGLQCHGGDRKALYAGERSALNLIGPNAEKIRRGDWLCSRDFYRATEIIDLDLKILDDAPILKNRDRVRLHIGTDEAIGRVVLIGSDILEPGDRGFGQFISEKPLIATRGDRVVIRRYSPLQTLGGGTVLDPFPQRKRRSKPESLEAFEKLTAAEGVSALREKVIIEGKSGLSLASAAMFLNLPHRELRKQVGSLLVDGSVVLVGSAEDGRLVSARVIGEVRDKILQRVDEQHKRFPQLLGVKRASLVADLAEDYAQEIVEFVLEKIIGGEVILDRNHLRRRDHVIQLDPELETKTRQVERLLNIAGLIPPDPSALLKELHLSESELNRILDIMIQQNRVVRMADGSFYSTAVVKEAWGKIKARLEAGGGLTMSELREILGCPRRYAVSLLEHFDRLGLTERREDLRFPGTKFDEIFFV